MSDIGKWYEQWSHSSGSIIDESFQSEKKEEDDIISLIKNNKQIYMNPAYKRYAKNVTMSIVDPSYIYSKVIGGIVPVKLYRSIPKHQKYDSVYEFGFDKDGKCLYRKRINAKANKIDRLYAYSHNVIYELDVYDIIEDLDVFSCCIEGKYYMNEKNNPLKIYRHYGALNVEKYDWINDYIAFINTGVHTYILLKNEKDVIAVFEKRTNTEKLFSYRTQNKIIFNEQEINLKEQSLNGYVSLKYDDIYDIQNNKTEYKYIEINGDKHLVFSHYIKPPIGFSYRKAKEVYSYEVLQFIDKNIAKMDFQVKYIGIELFYYGDPVTDLIIGFHDDECDDIHSMKQVFDLYFQDENINLIYQLNDYIHEHAYYHSFYRLVKTIKSKIEEQYDVNVLLIEVQD